MVLVTCQWLFAEEMLDGEEPMALDGVWRCQTHGGRER
jgi:hypothetical protein